MSSSEAWVPAGRVGKPHGRDGSFYVNRASHGLAAGTPVMVGATESRISHRGGMDARPLVRLEGVATREAAGSLTGETLFAPASGIELATGEWFSSDLVGCVIPALGDVRRVVSGPSCDLLEVGDERVLVPFVSDAITQIDSERGVIAVDYEFLGIATSR